MKSAPELMSQKPVSLAQELASLQALKLQLEKQLAEYSAEMERLTADKSSLQTRNAQLDKQLLAQSSELMRLVEEDIQHQLRLELLEQKLVDQERESMHQNEQFVHRLKTQDIRLKSALRSARALSEQNQLQKRVIKSAYDWQSRSWAKRGFHRWRAPDYEAQRLAALKQEGLTNKSDPTLGLDGLPATANEVRKKITSDTLLTIFNGDYYLKQNPDVADSNILPLDDYQSVGWKEGRNPHPYFDVQWYLQQNPDVAEAGIDPLYHYLTYGWHEGRNPHPFFDVQWYLKQYSDVSDIGFEPLHHYLEWGWKEDRQPNRFGDGDWFLEYIKQVPMVSDFESEKILSRGVRSILKTLDLSKPNILLVTHNTSRTGAPTIILNIATALRKKYNVLLLALGNGSLANAFRKESDVFLELPNRAHYDTKKLGLYIQLLIERCPIKFAIVNSIESSHILPSLARQNIPSVHLIHEFAEYSRPTTKLRNAVFHSGTTIFPARIVYENAVQVWGEIRHHETLILPQGLCQIPPADQSAEEVSLEKTRITNALRPPGWEDCIVVLGIGTVQMRKGVDLFFLCAEQLIKNNPAKKIRFVWAGADYDPEKDIHFSVYLASQLKRMAGIDAVSLLGEISQPALAYALADIFFVSSRLDPFPLVSQEAMHHALPVVCFENAVGTAEVLQSQPETAICVVPYLDVEGAVKQIQRFVDDPQLRKNTGLHCQRLAQESFDLEHYVTAVEGAALREEKVRQQEVLDAAIIAKSGLINLPWFCSPDTPAIWSNPAWWFARSWSSQINLRRPFPGFHPGIYSECQALAGRNPLAHFIEAGRPDGPWCSRVIQPEAIPLSDPAGIGRKTALHIHLFYPEMGPDILERLLKNKIRPDLFISVSDEQAAQGARKLFEPFAEGRLEVAVTPNRGRDIGAFLTGFGSDVWSGYEFVGHIHTKMSLWLKSPRFVELWSNLLLENLLGGKFPMMDTILATMAGAPGLGLVHPENPHVISWDDNIVEGQKLCDRLGLSPITKHHINFPVGTFFWARPAALEKLLALNLGWEDYPAEPLADDGTFLHAIERILPSLAENAGYSSAVTYVPGVTR